MSEKKVFCEECRDDVKYTVKQQQLTGTLKGETYSYNGKVARCAECNSEVFVSEICDYNLRSLYNEYRDKNGIIPLDEVLEIPKKYAIGKRPLSLLLGWGEQTFSRYCDGDVPTKQYSDILQKILSEPEYYNQILEENKSNLRSEATYKKSKKAVDALLAGEASNNTKVDLVIGYLLHQCEDITPLSLQKALYYIQGFYYAFYKKYLFSEECQAWVHGPVYRDVYLRYRYYRFDPIKGEKEFDDTVFSSSEKAILDSVVKHVCCYSGKVLEKFTHSETPWIITRGNLPETESSDKIIPKVLIGEYFVSVKEKYNMLNTNDIKAYTQSMFQQI